MNEPPIAIELDCMTGIETVRPLTVEEIAQRDADQSRAEAERLAKEAQAATEAKTSPEAQLDANDASDQVSQAHAAALAKADMAERVLRQVQLQAKQEAKARAAAEARADQEIARHTHEEAENQHRETE